MNKTIKLELCAAIVALFLNSQITLAQWNIIGTGIGDRWAQTDNTNLNNTIRRGGMGNFIDFSTAPAAAFHINANLLTPVNPLALNTFLPGEVFRTTATNTNINAWRLFTGAGNGTEKGMIFNYGNNPVVADQTNFSLQATDKDITFHTGKPLINGVAPERMRILANGNVQLTNLSNEKKSSFIPTQQERYS